jgi:diguanylate cyclase (GGDEF)-like protein/PAS domain S-box-containing protein
MRPKLRSFKWHKTRRSALLDGAARARAVFERAGAGLVVATLDGRLIECNPAFQNMIGYSAAELRSVSLADLSHPDDLEHCQKMWHELLADQRDAFQTEKRFLDKGYQTVWCSVTATVVRDLIGRPSFVVGVVEDISLRKATELVMNTRYEAEHRQRQLAQVLREVSTVLSATLDYETVLGRLLEQVQRLVPCDAADILLVEDGQARVARRMGVDRLVGQPDAQTPRITFEIAATPNLHWMVENQRPLVIPDTAAYPGWVQVKESEFIRSSACAPVLVQGEVIAFIVLNSAKPNYFHLEQGDLLALFAGQAALALENAHLYAEAMQTLERERGLNEVTRAISSAVDLTTILNSVVRLAAELVGADCGCLAMVNPGDQTITFPYLYNLPVEFSHECIAGDKGLAWLIIETGESFLLPDYAAHPAAQPAWVAVGVKAFIGVPVVAGDVCLGSLGLFSLQAGKRFGERELELAKSVSRQVGIAIRNVQLLESARRRAEEADTLRQAVSVVSSSLDLERVLDTILVQLDRVVPFDSAALFLIEGDLLHLVSGRGFTIPEQIIGQSFPVSDALVSEIRRTSQPLILPDAAVDARFHDWGKENYVRGWIGVPLLLHGGFIGCLTIDSRQLAAYDMADAALAQAFANEAAIAIESARLFSQVQHMAITDPLTELYNRRHFYDVAISEFERSRRYGHNLSLIMLDIDHFKRVNDTYGHLAGDQVLKEVARRCLQVVREVDVVARYGGEEFITLLPETTLEGAAQAAERMKECITGQPIVVGEKQVEVSVSIGAAEIDERCLDLEALLERADQAMYAAKRAGRGKVSLWQNGEKREAA